MTRPWGLFVLGRATFDVPYAEARVAEALVALRAAGVVLQGDPGVLFDNDAVAARIADLQGADLAGVLVVQATFTDSEAVVRIADALGRPLHIWALPEPRSGGRLRLNAFCGLNLAAHALGLRDRAMVPLYADPVEAGTGDRLHGWLDGSPLPVPQAFPAQAPEIGAEAGAQAVAALRGARIGRIGAHPAGFDTCAYDDARLQTLAGVTVEPLALESLFDAARATPAAEVAQTRAALAPAVAGLEAVDQDQLDRSLRLRSGLEQLRGQGGYAGFAIRCWPETFTDYGGAVCGPVGMMGEARVPCACEADVYGTLTTLLLQQIADAPVFLADIVDMDAATDSAVLWHCGQAPASMADPAAQPRAGIHSNRRMPLLLEFALKPGRVTLARISQARGQQALVLAGGEMLAAPPSFSGTSGVLRFDAPMDRVRDAFLGAGVEHHLALAYGDHRAALHHAARALDLPVLDLCQ